jgi:hypothetical protein
MTGRRAWFHRHNELKEVVTEDEDALTKFIEAQKVSGDACSSRLLEAKRSLDGLLHDLKSLSMQVEDHETVLEVEQQNLKATDLSIDAVEDQYEEETAKCTEEREKALEDLDQYRAELAELQQIAKPSVRYEHVVNVEGMPEAKPALLEEGTWTVKSCEAFVSYAKKHKDLKFMSLVQDGGTTKLTAFNEMHGGNNASGAIVKEHQTEDDEFASGRTLLAPRPDGAFSLASTANQCKGRQHIYQKRYSAWCDKEVGSISIDGVKVRSQWCRSRTLENEKCDSKADFKYCWLAYFGCTAEEEDAQRCCTHGDGSTSNEDAAKTSTSPPTESPTSTSPLTESPTSTSPPTESPTSTSPGLESNDDVEGLEPNDGVEGGEGESNTGSGNPVEDDDTDEEDIFDPEKEKSPIELNCNQQRKKLQRIFSKAYNAVKDLKKDAKERSKDKTCQEMADAKKASLMVPLVAQREQATGRIEYSAAAVTAITPVLKLVDRRVDKLQEYVNEKLTPECKEASEVSKYLQNVRDLIISLEKCPGRNDFTLKVKL